MVKALLAGRKTQTRRLVSKKLPPSARFTGIHYACDEPDCWFFNSPAGPYKVPVRFEPDDRLWVREAWSCHWACDNQKPADIDPELWSVRYAAEGHIRPAARDGSLALENQFTRLRPSIHMPRWASRLTLNVTDVRVEPLQAISREDAIAEGLRFRQGVLEQWWHLPEPYEGHNWLSPVAAYEFLWTQLHGRESWDANPLVVALTFTVEQRCAAQA